MFVITMMKPGYGTGHLVRDENYRRGEYAVTMIQHKENGQDYFHTWQGSASFLVPNEEQAQAFIKHLARQMPGVDVYLAEVKNVAQAVISDVAVKAVNEKGVLPA